MPQLNWPSKHDPEPASAGLKTEAVFALAGQNRLDTHPENHLILGDNFRVMSALLPEYEEKIDLIYADPPFFTNRGYAARVGRGEDSRQPQEWELAKGYQDEWKDLDAYLEMLYTRLKLMYRLLSPTGSLYLHLDWHANSYARVLLDEIFGYDRLNNEIIWTYHGPSPIRSAFNRKHDMILFYTKSQDYTFNVDDVRVPYSDSTVNTFHSSEKAGFGKTPNLKRGKVPEDWWYFPVVARLHSERTGYPTQKPESLLERIIRASSNPGDLVADFFAGSGTTPVVAARLGRRFLASDAQWRAIHTTRSRFVQDAAQGEGEEVQPVAFLVQREERVPEAQFKEVTGGAVLQESKIVLHPEEVAGLDYWEVDPDWQGDVFQSVVQAARPRRNGDIPTQLDLPYRGEQVCVRYLKVNGNQFQEIIPGT